MLQQSCLRQSPICYRWFLQRVLLPSEQIIFSDADKTIYHPWTDTIFYVKLMPDDDMRVLWVLWYETRVHQCIFLVPVGSFVKDEPISLYCQQFIKRFSCNHCLQRKEVHAVILCLMLRNHFWWLYSKKCQREKQRQISQSVKQF